MEQTRLSPKIVTRIIVMNLNNLDCMILLCDGLYIAGAGGIVGFPNHVGNEGGNEFGETDDGKANESVENHLLGTL